MRPHRRQPTRLPRPWDSPGKNTGVATIIKLSRGFYLSSGIVGIICYNILRVKSFFVIVFLQKQFEDAKLSAVVSEVVSQTPAPTTQAAGPPLSRPWASKMLSSLGLRGVHQLVGGFQEWPREKLSICAPAPCSPCQPLVLGGPRRAESSDSKQWEPGRPLTPTTEFLAFSAAL